jgi:hypothetical protein
MITTVEYRGHLIEIKEDGYPLDFHTAPGVKCGNHLRGVNVYHFNVAAVHYCYAVTREEQEAFEDAARAEMAAERALEDRGYWEARAQEDHEAAHGVISFEDAYRAACPWLFEN